MQSAQLKVGDVVQLKSGGPHMTIDEVRKDGDVRCVWFSGDKPEHAVFKPDVLTKV